jgi:hypothetical protein
VTDHVRYHDGTVEYNGVREYIADKKDFCKNKNNLSIQ